MEDFRTANAKIKVNESSYRSWGYMPSATVLGSASLNVDDPMLWLISAWIAGTVAILGSLMMLGSLILLAAPTQSRSRKPQQSLPTGHPWSQRLKLLGVSLVMALAGLGVLILIPFPSP